MLVTTPPLFIAEAPQLVNFVHIPTAEQGCTEHSLCCGRRSLRLEHVGGDLWTTDRRAGYLRRPFVRRSLPNQQHPPPQIYTTDSSLSVRILTWWKYFLFGNLSTTRLIFRFDCDWFDYFISIEKMFWIDFAHSHRLFFSYVWINDIPPLRFFPRNFTITWINLGAIPQNNAHILRSIFCSVFLCVFVCVFDSRFFYPPPLSQGFWTRFSSTWRTTSARLVATFPPANRHLMGLWNRYWTNLDSSIVGERKILSLQETFVSKRCFSYTLSEVSSCWARRFLYFFECKNFARVGRGGM